MNYKKCLGDAVILVEAAETDLCAMKELYLKSLEDKQIDPLLLVKVKMIFENLRSALDYVAQGLVLRYCPGHRGKVYFPYASSDVTKEQFIKSNRIEKSIPGLVESRPDLADFIISMQHFSRPGAEWFPQFMELNNRNKHVHLVPSGLVRGVRLSFDGSSIFAESIVLGESGQILTSSGVLKGPLLISPDNVNEFEGYGVFYAEAWESIYIDGYGFPMNSLEFVGHCVRAISAVVKSFERTVP